MMQKRKKQMTRTGSYIQTVGPDSLKDAYAALRPLVKRINQAMAEEGSAIRYRVSAKGRLGPNNPEAPRYYRRRSYTVRAVDSQRVDLYLHTQCVSYDTAMPYKSLPSETRDVVMAVLRDATASLSYAPEHA